ncbi:hypothetical protein [Actinoplanes sp. NPDC051851]|uniref:hypothetical protein n=1 Tax=Actinoplanes sp. NPDC051851 TaxID=3154753 RepID=UPI003415CF5D
MRVDVTPESSAGLRDAAGDFYRDAFARLATPVVNRHPPRRDEFEELTADHRAPKYALYEMIRRAVRVP